MESGTVFSDINLQEKVQDLAALWGAIQHLVEIILLVNKAGFYDNPTCGAKGLPSDHMQEGWDVPFGENTS